MISGLERKKIEMISKGNFKMKGNKPSDAIQSLMDRGYLKTVDERLGPLGIKTGEFILRVTEAGMSAIERTHA